MTEPTSALDSAPGDSPRPRRRTWILALSAIVVVVLVAGAIVVVALSGGEETKPVAKPAPTTTMPPVTTTLPKPAEVATSKVLALQAFDAPNSPNVVATLSNKTEYEQPRTLLVTAHQGDWLKVLLPVRPNGTEGWVRLSDVELTTNPYRITVNLAEHTVRLYKDGQELVNTLAVVGADRTPTPVGFYYVTDPVDLTANPNGAYGAYALGLSAFSDVLFSFNGGPGQIAIHGTNNPGLVGQNVSNGCIRVPNDVILQIASQAPLGTPVLIV